MRSLELFGTVAAAALAGAVAAATDDWFLAFGFVGLVVLLLLGATRPATFLVVFLLLRPMLENVGAENAPAAVALLVIALAGIVIVTGRDVVYPSATPVMFGVLAVSAVVALEAYLEYHGTVQSKVISEMARLVALLAMYLLGANALRDRLRTLYAVVAYSGVVPALYGIQKVLMSPEVNENTGVARANGPFSGPNPFGVYMAFSLLVLIGAPKGWIPRWARFACAVPIGTALVLSYSRGGWAFFLIGVVFLYIRKQPLAILGVVLVAVAVTFSVPAVHDRILPKEDASSQEESFESFGWRLDNWNVLLDKWAERPILGHGMKTTTLVNPRVPSRAQGQEDGGYDAHNMAVRVLVEGGVVLLVAWIAFFAVILMSMHRLARARWKYREAARLVSVLWWLVVLNGLTVADTLSTTAMLFPLLAMTGAVEAAWRRRPAPPAPPPASESGNGADPIHPVPARPQREQQQPVPAPV